MLNEEDRPSDRGLTVTDCMMMEPTGPLTLRLEVESWPLTGPFRIAGHTITSKDILLVSLEKEGRVGRAEAVGVRYRSDDAAQMMKQIEAVRPAVEKGLSRASLQQMLPPGGARNALDCALWDLQAKLSGRTAWEIAGVGEPRPLLTLFTCGADEPERMAEVACGYIHARAIKVKLTGESIDAERIRAVRAAREDVWLSVDANQGFTRASLEKLMPVLVDARVALIEQPFPIGQEALLDGFASPIPIAADESVQSLADLSGLLGRFSFVNIKLDKCGGLTEGLAMARAARELGFKTWVGNMIGTSLAMAPAFVLGQICDFVELDGPLFLASDREHPVCYHEGTVLAPAALWGN